MSSNNNLALTLLAGVSSPAGTVNGGTVTFTLLDGAGQKVASVERPLKPLDQFNDEAARFALTERGYYFVLALPKFQATLKRGRFLTIETFLKAYDLLNEYDLLDVELASEVPPLDPKEEGDWCKKAVLRTNAGKTGLANLCMAGGVALVGELNGVPEALAVTESTVKEVSVGAVRYAGSVAKLLG